MRSREAHGASVIFTCAPNSAFVNIEAAKDNTWQDTGLAADDTTLEAYEKEHDGLVKALRQRGVLVVNTRFGRGEGQDQPDAIFMNNSISVHARKIPAYTSNPTLLAGRAADGVGMLGLGPKKQFRLSYEGVNNNTYNSGSFANEVADHHYAASFNDQCCRENLTFNVVLYPMSSGRRDEIPARLLRAFEALPHLFPGSKVVDLRHMQGHGQVLEGTGALIFDATETNVVISRSQRTTDAAIGSALSAIGIDPLNVALFTSHDDKGRVIYHTNIVGWRGARLAAWCTDAMEFPSLLEEKRFYHLHNETQIIKLSRQEMNSFCGNSLEVTSAGEGRRLLVMSETAYRGLSAENRAIFERHYGDDGIIHVPIPTIEKYGGGSVRCLLTHCALPSSATLEEMKKFVDLFEPATVRDGHEPAAEWHTPSLILVHTPNSGGELTIPGLHPDSALFENPFDPDLVHREHDEFVRRLRMSAHVITVKEALLAGTEDPNGAATCRLRQLAHKCIDLRGPPERSEIDKKRLAEAINSYSPNQLFRVAMAHPVLTLSPTPGNTLVSAHYSVKPLMNLLYMRDQSITTNAGRVLARLASEQRELETIIVEAVLDAIGQPPIYAIKAPGTLEGGDFIPAGEYCFIGVGLRTNMDAIQQLLDNDCFGCRYVVVVKDNHRDQEEMHLDTYFNLINQSLCVMLERRIFAASTSPHYTACDVYERNKDFQQSDSGSPHKDSPTTTHVDDKHRTSSFVGRPCSPTQYKKVTADVPFSTFLRETLRMNIIPVLKEDQLIYGCNFLTLSPNEILLVKRGDGVSSSYREALTAHGVRFTECNMTSITKLYGAAHCMTQVSRLPPGSTAATAGMIKRYGSGSTMELDAKLK